MRSAAPLSFIALPMMAAAAMTTPSPPAVEPKASATRVISSAVSPGDRTLTRSAAPIRARNAFKRRTTIPPMTVAMPMRRIRTGCTGVPSDRVGQGLVDAVPTASRSGDRPGQVRCIWILSRRCDRLRTTIACVGRSARTMRDGGRGWMSESAANLRITPRNHNGPARSGLSGPAGSSLSKGLTAAGRWAGLSS